MDGISFIRITLVYPSLLKDTPRFSEVEGCALREIESSPVLQTCEILGAQHMISMEIFFKKIPSCPGTIVRRHGPTGRWKSTTLSSET